MKTQAHEEADHVTMGGRDWSEAATGREHQGCWKPPEAGRGKKGFFPGVFREHCRHLDFTLLVSRL